MPRLVAFPIPLLLFACLAPAAFAADNNYVTPVFPVRAREYWRQGKDIAGIKRISNLVINNSVSSTWLLQYDALSDREVVDSLPTHKSELGIFMEVTRKLAEDSFVKYDWQHGNWSQANKVFLSGYTRDERRRMIDKVFTSFRAEFGYYPKSYGAWYVDVWSMQYIKDKYQADVLLGLADQYSTDGYQTWGQYFDLPYFVSKRSAIEPAESLSDSTGVLKLQWAPRHPVLAYGTTYDSSNYSAQINDYHGQKGLGREYFENLIRDLTQNVSGKISQAVIGIEAGELEEKNYPELEFQLKVLNGLQDKKILELETMSDFDNLYRQNFPAVSPESTIMATDSGTTVTWFMSPQMRYATKQVGGQILYFDLRFYHASNYRDNDQILPDPRPNLVRLVPAVIDDLLYKNSTATAILTPPESREIDLKDNYYGHYSGKFPKLKSLLVNLATYIPEIVYSDLEGQKYFGLRTGYESFFGFRIPGLKIGGFEFKFPVLENFISLKKKLTPGFSWEGKQEIELSGAEKPGTVIPKGWAYGQESLSKPAPGKIIYENSYYQVISP